MRRIDKTDSGTTLNIEGVLKEGNNRDSERQMPGDRVVRGALSAEEKARETNVQRNQKEQR